MDKIIGVTFALIIGAGFLIFHRMLAPFHAKWFRKTLKVEVNSKMIRVIEIINILFGIIFIIIGLIDLLKILY